MPKGQALELRALIARIQPQLAGHELAVQGLALGHLVTAWLSCIECDDQEEQVERRAAALCEFVRLVAELMQLNALVLLAKLDPERLH